MGVVTVTTGVSACGLGGESRFPSGESLGVSQGGEISPNKSCRMAGLIGGMIASNGSAL